LATPWTRRLAKGRLSAHSRTTSSTVSSAVADTTTSAPQSPARKVIHRGMRSPSLGRSTFCPISGAAQIPNDRLDGVQLFFLAGKRFANVRHDIGRGFAREGFVRELDLRSGDEFLQLLGLFLLTGQFGLAVDEAFKRDVALGVAQRKAGGGRRTSHVRSRG